MAKRFTTIEQSCFGYLAQKIAGPGAPVWLMEHFTGFAPLVSSNHHIETTRPTGAEMNKDLQIIQGAAKALVDLTGDTSVAEYLEEVGRLRVKHQAGLANVLTHLARHSEIALEFLSLQSGKRGPWRAIPPGMLPAKLVCAILIVEAWQFIYGEYPCPGNENAREAADILWSISGGEKSRAADKANVLQRWRSYFKRATAKTVATELKAELRRHLALSAHGPRPN